MRQKGRKVPPLDPDAIHRSEVISRMPTDAAWDEAEGYATLDRHLVAAGVVQHRITQRWHTWISLYGTDLTSWYVGADQSTAHAILAAIHKLISEWGGDEESIESMNALIAVASEYSSHPKDTLPDDQVREQLAEVARRQIRKN